MRLVLVEDWRDVGFVNTQHSLLNARTAGAAPPKESFGPAAANLARCRLREHSTLNTQGGRIREFHLLLVEDWRNVGFVNTQNSTLNGKGSDFTSDHCRL